MFYTLNPQNKNIGPERNTMLVWLHAFVSTKTFFENVMAKHNACCQACSVFSSQGLNMFSKKCRSILPCIHDIPVMVSSFTRSTQCIPKKNHTGREMAMCFFFACMVLKKLSAF